MECVLFTGMTLIDGTGAQPIPGASMLCEGGVIARIGVFDAPENYKVVDLAGKFVLPGIIDCHVHGGLDGGLGCIDRAAALNAAETTIVYLNSARKLLSDGVTFFREMGSKGHVDIAVAAAAARGGVESPDILPCGGLITQTGGHCWQLGRECDGADEVVKGVRAQIKAGARSIKFMATGGIHTPGNRTNAAQLSVAELAAGVDEAHKFGLVTGAHCFGSPAARSLLEAGIDSIEHGCFLCDDEQAVDRMVEQGVYYVPTIYAIKAIANDDPALGLHGEFLEKAQRAHEKHVASFKLALKKGVKIAFGTDRGTTYNPHESGSVELTILHGLGMPAMDVIKSFSSTAAELLRVSAERGTLERGKRADFIVVDRDPLGDIGALAGRKQVYMRGERKA